MDLDASRPDATGPDETGAAGASLLDAPLDEPFDRLVSLARDLIGAPYAFVTIVDDQRSSWRAAVGVELRAGQVPRDPLVVALCQDVVRDRRPLMLDDVRSDDRTHDHPGDHRGDHRVTEDSPVMAWAGYPVVGPDGQVLGTFCVADTEPRAWTLMDVRVLRTLSLAVGNEIALRLRAAASEQGLAGAAQDRDAAHRLAFDAVSAAEAAQSLSLALQHSMLSPPVAGAGLEVAGRYQSASAQHRVGGDWYDAFAEPDGGTTLVIGDVSGHAVQAAAAMAQVRGFVRAFAYGTADTPAEVLRRTDGAIAGLGVSGLTTAVVARVQPPEQPGEPARMCWSNAGHPAPLLRHPDGRVEALTRPHDLLLGVSSAADRADHEVLLQPGTTILLATDGLTGPPDEAPEVASARLARAFDEAGALDLQEAADLMLTTLGRRSRDDVALLIARVPAPPGPWYTPSR